MQSLSYAREAVPGRLSRTGAYCQCFIYLLRQGIEGWKGQECVQKSIVSNSHLNATMGPPSGCIYINSDRKNMGQSMKRLW